MKAKLDFVLENAGWPALMVDDTATIRAANQSAVATFGPVLEGESALLTSVWAPENETSPEQFLVRLERSQGASIPLHLKVKRGTTLKFRAQICQMTRDNQRFFVLQLFGAGPNEAPAGPSPPAGPLDNAPSEASSAQKQKLDCALQLIRSVVLDFNNALTSILGHASHLLSKTEANHPWRKALLEIEKSAEKGAEIAQDLAAFSRQEKDSRALSDGNLNDLVRRSVSAFQSATAGQPEWYLELEPQLFSVHFDEAKMQQAFVKILENSIDAVQAMGSISVRTRNLELSQPLRDGHAALSAGRFVCVEFSDSGCGIAPEIQSRLFEPFFTTKANHRGLGLAWVYGIVTNHGGSVAISSLLGEGTTVRIYLPAGSRVVHDHALKNDDLNGHQSILIVDDEDLMLTMGQMVLSDSGYQVQTANSAEKALDLLSRSDSAFDLVITDMVMPQMSGRELMERMRRVSPDVRFLCCSGFVRPASGANENALFLQKPFTSQELLRKVKQALTHWN